LSLFIASLKFFIKEYGELAEPEYGRKANFGLPAESNSILAVAVFLPLADLKQYSNALPTISAFKPLDVFEAISFISLSLSPAKVFSGLVAELETAGLCQKPR